MKVTPIKKKFGRYAPGEEFELPDKAARIFIKAKKLAAVVGGFTVSTPAVEPVAEPVQAPEQLPEQGQSEPDIVDSENAAEPLTYETRQLKAEEPESKPSSPVKRAYNRRNLTAKE